MGYVKKSGNPMTEVANPWVGSVCSDLGQFFGHWLNFLPSTSDGLKNIEELNYLVWNNPAGIFFLNRLESKTGGRDTFCPEVLDWTTRWLAARMDYMDSGVGAVCEQRHYQSALGLRRARSFVHDPDMR